MKKRVKSLPWVVSYASRNFVKFCLLWIFSLSSLMIQAQDNQRISIDLRGETLEAALWYLQNRTKFVFMYGTEDIANVTDITIKAKDKTITEILDECLEGTNLTYEISGSAIVIKSKARKLQSVVGFEMPVAKHYPVPLLRFEAPNMEPSPDWTDIILLIFRHKRD